MYKMAIWAFDAAVYRHQRHFGHAVSSGDEECQPARAPPGEEATKLNMRIEIRCFDDIKAAEDKGDMVAEFTLHYGRIITWEEKIWKKKIGQMPKRARRHVDRCGGSMVDRLDDDDDHNGRRRWLTMMNTLN